MKSKIAIASEALKNIEASTDAEKQLLDVARKALSALRSVRKNNLEKALINVQEMAQAGDRAGLTVVGLAMGQDYGPYTQPPAILEYN